MPPIIEYVCTDCYELGEVLVLDNREDICYPNCNSCSSKHTKRVYSAAAFKMYGKEKKNTNYCYKSPHESSRGKTKVK